MKQILTSNGVNLILRGLAGSKIEFTKIKFGNGEEQDITAVDLSNPIMEVPISSITRDGNFITLGADYKNADVPTEFSVLEIGVFAKDPDDETKEILYCLWYEEDPVKADYISPVEDRMLGTKIEILVFVDTVANVTAIIAETTEFATKTALLEHVNDTGNAHKMSKDDIGLGNVPNVTPENQVPVFDQTIGPIDVSVSNDVAAGTQTRTTSFPNIENGDTLGAMLKKIRTAINVLLSHINGKNSHNMTYKDIDAAPTTHHHSATDITRGTLGVARGGTGGSNPLEARRSLGIQSGSGTVTGTAGEAVYKSFDFPVAFASIPKVVLTLRTEMKSTDVYVAVTDVTTTGFTVYVYSQELAPIINFNWIAIQ